MRRRPPAAWHPGNLIFSTDHFQQLYSSGAMTILARTYWIDPHKCGSTPFMPAAAYDGLQ